MSECKGHPGQLSAIVPDQRDVKALGIISINTRTHGAMLSSSSSLPLSLSLYRSVVLFVSVLSFFQLSIDLFLIILHRSLCHRCPRAHHPLTTASSCCISKPLRTAGHDRYQRDGNDGCLLFIPPPPFMSFFSFDCLFWLSRCDVQCSLLMSTSC